MIPLGPREVHIHWVREDRVTDPALLAEYEAMLSPEEKARLPRFLLDWARHQFLLTRALARTTLSRYVEAAPEAWTFEPGPHGRPEIRAPQTRLCFNLTNTRGFVACAVAWDREIGVDVEDTDRPRAGLEVADRFFSPLEVAGLRATPEAMQRERFFAYWTLKESYIKARSMGLALPLWQFSFHLPEDVAACRPTRISFDPALDDDPASWQFELWRPTERHMVSLAIRRRGEPDLPVTLREVVPLGP